MQFDIVANDKATGPISGVEKAVGELSKKIAGFFTATALFDRALGLLQQGFQAFVDTLKDTAALNDQAKAAGLTTDEFQRLGIAAKEAGLDQQALMKGLKTIKEFLRDARVEGSRQADVLKALGYSQDDITSGNVDAMEAMMRLSGAVEAAETAQQKYNVAASIFGAKAQELIPLLDGLRTAMAQAAAEPIVSQQSIDRLDQAEKRVDRMIRLLKVMSAETVSNLKIPGAIPGGDLANLGITVGTAALDASRPKPIPVTEKDKANAEALAKLGMTSASGSSGGISGVSSAQSLGMATSIALAQQQTAYLATIAANTSPDSGGALPGRTNFTRPADATESDLRDTYTAIKYRRSPVMSRPGPAR